MKAIRDTYFEEMIVYNFSILSQGVVGYQYVIIGITVSSPPHQHMCSTCELASTLKDQNDWMHLSMHKQCQLFSVSLYSLSLSLSVYCYTRYNDNS